MIRKKIIKLAGPNHEQLQCLEQLFTAVCDLSVLDPDATWEGADAVIGFDRATFNAVFLPNKLLRAPSVRWYHAPGAGVEEYMSNLPTEVAFTLTNGKVIQGPEVADHALALVLALTRRLHYVLQNRPNFPRPVELKGKTVVVIGAGGIGTLIAERASAFGMSVLAVTEDQIPIVSFVDEIYFSDRLFDVLPRGDVVIMAAPLTATSRHMMDRTAFAGMKSGSYFVNVSRGGTVDTDALWDAISCGHLAGAGLDVTDPEPLPDGHPLLTHPDVIVSDHMAGISDNLRHRSFDLIVTNLRRFCDGRTLINTVDLKRGY